MATTPIDIGVDCQAASHAVIAEPMAPPVALANAVKKCLRWKLVTLSLKTRVISRRANLLNTPSCAPAGTSWGQLHASACVEASQENLITISHLVAFDIRLLDYLFPFENIIYIVFFLFLLFSFSRFYILVYLYLAHYRSFP